jgi:hypothetical protein
MLCREGSPEYQVKNTVRNCAMQAQQACITGDESSATQMESNFTVNLIFNTVFSRMKMFEDLSSVLCTAKNPNKNE